MIEKEINDRLDEMYRGEKSKKFLTHLIRAYFPVGKIEKVWDKPKGRFRCAITNEPLISIEEAYQVVSGKDYFDKTMAHIKSGFSDDSEKVEHPAIIAFGKRKMGVTTEDTDTFLSMPVYSVFYSWLVTKLLNGDKHINWLLRQMQDDMFFDKVKSLSPEKGKKDYKKQIEKPKTATFGDLDALQKLKVQMEAAEKEQK